MGTLSLNPFDAAIYLVALVAIVMGFHAGLLRSLATIFGYLVAAPVAVAATPPLSKFFTELFHLPPDVTDFIDRLKRARDLSVDPRPVQPARLAVP